MAKKLMENDKEADEAIEKLNDTELEGRKVVVNFARPREARPRFDNGGGGPRREERPRGEGRR
jgi:RNA recognition motif-containing protein